MTSSSEKALEEYVQHPHHEEVCEQYLFPVLDGGADGLLVFDYEMQ